MKKFRILILLFNCQMISSGSVVFGLFGAGKVNRCGGAFGDCEVPYPAVALVLPCAPDKAGGTAIFRVDKA